MLKKIMFSVLIILSLLIIFLIFLKNGIKINSFSLANIYISQLYLKLDKKLILKIKEFKINKKSQVNSSLDDISKTLVKIPKILSIFQEIDIKSLKINGNEFIIQINKDNFFLDNKFINLSAKAEFLENEIKLDLYSLYLKDYEILLDGKINIDLKNQSLEFLSKFTVDKFTGNVKIYANEFKTNILISSNKIKDLSFIKKYITLPSIAEDWIYKNIKGQKELISLKLEINNKTSTIVRDSISAEVLVSNAQIYFDKKLPPVKTNKINIIYKNDTLLIDLNKAKYLNKNLLGSKVTISNLSNKKGLVSVFIKARTILDQDILNLLSFYKINIPLIQKNGTTSSKVLLEFPYDTKKSLNVSGDFIVNNALLSFNGFEVFAKKGKIKLRNSYVKIYDAYITKKDLFKSSLNLKINLKKKYAKGNIVLDEFSLKAKSDNLISIKNHKSKISVNFNKITKIHLGKLNTDIILNKNSTDIKINDISVIYKNAGILDALDIKRGNININIISKNNIRFKAFAYDLNLPIKNNNKKVTKLNMYGSFINNKLLLKTLDNKIKITANKNGKINLFANDIDLMVFGGNTNASLPDIELEVKNINLYTSKVDNYNISRLSASIKDNKITFLAKLKNLDLPFKFEENKISTLNIFGTYINKTLNFTTTDKKMNFILNDKKDLKIKISDVDLVYESSIKDEKDKTTNNPFNSIVIKGKNSNIYFTKDKKILAKSYIIKIMNEDITINTYYGKSSLFYEKDINNKIILKAINLNDKFVNAFFNKDIIKDGLINISANSKKSLLKGSITIKGSLFKNMAIINNLVILVNSSPALINPLLAIPSVLELITQKGFDVNGYKVVSGKIDFDYDLNKNILKLNKIHTKGNSVDFDGRLKLDFNKDEINGTMYVIFMKSYSLLVKHIPLVNYLLLGDNNRVDTEVNFTGKISDPKIETNLTKNSLVAPLNIIKRIITLPIKAVKILIPEDKSKK